MMSAPAEKLAPRCLPHRVPFLFVDRVVTASKTGGRVLRVITRNDALLQGYPTVPPVLIVEALAQAAGVLVGTTEGIVATGFLSAVDDFVFYRPVRCGEQLILEVTLRRARGSFYAVRGRALVSDEVRAEGRLTLSRELPRDLLPVRVGRSLGGGTTG